MLAAQYVRMSTERQDYSIANQKAAIESYALQHNFEIVKTYVDPGKSGVSLARRPGLQKLLSDVATTNPEFGAILVYDITRWGRFQDIDESAYYEFLCKRAGVQIHYCAESFASDDPSVMTALLKSIKRVMAGEFLRELSVKVFVGQCRIAGDGYKIGGKPGYGLRRLLVSRDGTSKQILADGERKSLSCDRVRYVPGPQEEIETVRRIYSWYLDDGYSAAHIARLLNEGGVRRPKNAPWDKYVINTILNHQKYAGCVVFNRTSKKLGAKSTLNPTDQWIVAPTGFDPIISTERFLAVRQRRKRMDARSDAEFVADLHIVLRKHGKLTTKTIRATSGVPSPNSYCDRFGSLGKAYEAAGYKALRGYFGGSVLRKKTHRLKEGTTRQFADLFRTGGRKVRFIPHGLFIPGFGSLGIEPAQWIHTRKGDLVWVVTTGTHKRYRHMIVGRISPDHESILDFLFFNTVPRTKCNFRLTDARLNNEVRGSVEEIAEFINRLFK